MILQRFSSLLQVRPGEGRVIFPLTGLMFCLSAGGTIGSSGVQALFFARFGVEFLPYMYLALGGVTLVTSLTLTAALSRVPRRSLYQFLPLAMAAFLIGSRILVAADSRWFYPPLWLGYNLLWTLQTLLVWGLGGSLCDTRQAKRLFPLIAAGGIVGVTIGGLATKLVVGVFGTANLLLAWALAMIIGFALVVHLARSAKGLDERSGRDAARLSVDLRRGYFFTRNSSLFRWKAVAALLFSVLLFSVAFPFSKALVVQFPQEDELAAFLGAFQGLSNGVAFVVSLLIANRLFARYGVMSVALAYPVIYLIGFIAVALTGSFSTLVGFRFVQLLWLFGVAVTGHQAVFNLVPQQRREQVRTFIDGVPGQLGVALTGLILIVGEQQLPPQQMYLVGAFLALTAIYTVWRARSAYAEALVGALRTGHPHIFYSEEQPFGGFQQDAQAVATVIGGISDPDPAVRRVSAEILGNLSVPEAAAALVKSLGDPDPGVRVASLRGLAQAEASPAMLELAACLDDPEPEVRLQAVESLRHLAGYSGGLVALLQPLLEDPAPMVRAHSALALLQAGSVDGAREVLEVLTGFDDPEVRSAAIGALAEWGDPAVFSVVASGFDDPHAGVRRVTAASLTRFQAEQCLGTLIQALSDEDETVRQAVAEALILVGPLALEPVLGALEIPDFEEGALLALRHFSLRRHRFHLTEYADGKVDQALRLDRFWHLLDGSASQDRRLALLSESLRESARGQAVRAFRAHALLGDSDAVDLAIESLGYPEPEQIANALETLETTLDRRLVASLVPLWDAAPSRESSEGRTGNHNAEMLEQLLGDPDPWIRACAALAAGAFPSSGVRELLAQQAESDPDAIVRETALRALNGGPSMDTLATLSQMERILLLRQVPLFAQFPPAELKQVAGIAGEHLYSDGDLICRQGEPGDEMYIIASGRVEVVMETTDGQPSEIAHRSEGDYVGEMAIISHEPRMASLIADGDVRLLCIDQQSFEGILRERPDTSLAIMRMLIQRLKESQASRESELRLSGYRTAVG